MPLNGINLQPQNSTSKPLFSHTQTHNPYQFFTLKHPEIVKEKPRMKNKFALCFRPVVIEAEEPEPDDHAAVPKDVIAEVQKKNGVMQPAMSPSLLDGSAGGSLHQVPCYPRPKNHSRKTLSGVLKTILCETSPRIRVQNGKIHQLTFPAKTNEDHAEERNGPLEKVDDAEPMKHERLREANFTDQENKITPNISSSQSSSSTSSTPSSTASTSVQPSKDLMKSLYMKRSLVRAGSNSFNQKKKAKTTKTNDRTLNSSSSSTLKSKDTVFYWMVLALLATILWGMVYAIILASLWLYFSPRRSGIDGRLPESDAGKLPEIEICNSWEYKKKIIMEGLLERKYQNCKEH